MSFVASKKVDVASLKRLKEAYEAKPDVPEVRRPYAEALFDLTIEELGREEDSFEDEEANEEFNDEYEVDYLNPDSKDDYLGDPIHRELRSVFDAYPRDEVVRKFWAESLSFAAYQTGAAAVDAPLLVTLRSLYNAYPDDPNVRQMWLWAIMGAGNEITGKIETDDPLFQALEQLHLAHPEDEEVTREWEIWSPK